MKKVLPVVAAALVCGLGSVASAAILHNETFSADGTVASYTGAGKIFSSSFGSASMVGASGGKMTLGLAANVGADSACFAVSSFTGSETLVSVKVDVTPTSYDAGSFRILVGDSDPGWAQWDPVARSFATIQIGSSGIAIGSGAATAFTMNQSHTLSLFFNNSGAAQSYVGPDNTTSYTLNDGSFSVFDGTSLLAGNVLKGGNRELTSFGMLVGRNWGGAQTLTDIDNLMIRNDLNVYPVPEPASLGLLALSGFAMLRRSRK